MTFEELLQKYRFVTIPEARRMAFADGHTLFAKFLENIQPRSSFDQKLGDLVK